MFPSLPSIPGTSSRTAICILAGALCALLLGLACAWGGYRHGHATATDKGDAKYAKLETAIAEANRLASKAAKEILDAEIVRRDKAEASLLSARAAIAAQGKNITNQRIANASRSVAPAADGHCVFGAAWVRLYNEALGLGDGDPAVPAAAPGAGGAAGAVPPAAAGQLPGAVTPEDVIATHRDNARLCRDTQARYLGLREWALGLPQTVEVGGR